MSFKIQSLRTDTSFDGFALVLTGEGPASIGKSESGIGYSGITNAIVVEFDFFKNTFDHFDAAVGVAGGRLVDSSTIEAKNEKELKNDYNDEKVHEFRVVFMDRGSSGLDVDVNTDGGQDAGGETFHFPAVFGESQMEEILGKDAKFFAGITSSTGGDVSEVNVLEFSVDDHNGDGCLQGYGAQGCAKTLGPAERCHSLFHRCTECVDSPLCCAWDKADLQCVRPDEDIFGDLAKRQSNLDVALNGGCEGQTLDDAGEARQEEMIIIILGSCLVALGIALVSTCVYWHARYNSLASQSATLGDMGQEYNAL